MPDFGRVSIDDPCNLAVYSQRGTATAQVGSESHLVEEGKAYRVRAMNEIRYRQYVSPDASDYHNHHQHQKCAVPRIGQTARARSLPGKAVSYWFPPVVQLVLACGKRRKPGSALKLFLLRRSPKR
jgi:hypothetical protein